MNKESHLPILIAMFPGKVLLTVEDIAKCLHVSPGHIYNLSYTKELEKKIKLHKEKGFSDKILVSIIEMARYLDKKLEPEKDENPQETPIPQLIKKRGRPRGSVSKRQAAFQSQLSLAIVRYQLEEVFESIQEGIETIEYQDDQGACSSKIEDLKSKFSESIIKARSSMFRSLLELGLSNKNSDKPTVTKV